MDNRQLPLVVNYEIEEGRLPLSIKLALGEHLVEIIGAGSKVPIKRTVEVSNSVDNQESLTIVVMQGLSKRREANAPVASYVITGLPEAPAGQLSISLEVAVTQSLGINISASDSKGNAFPIELTNPGKPLGQKAITGLSEEAERDTPDEFDGIYDDAKFHAETVALEELPEERAYVHTGMFLTWLSANGLLSESMIERNEKDIALIEGRGKSGPQWFRELGGALSQDMLNEEGNQFALDYFEFERGAFLEDYAKLLAPESNTMFVVEDNWENYDKLSTKLSSRFDEWKAKRAREESPTSSAT